MTEKTTIASYLVSLLGFLGGFSGEQWMSFLGGFFMVATFGMSWAYKHFQHKREERESEYERLKTEHLLGRKLPLQGNDDER
ncbi:MAG: hypothetical protein JKY93_01670 [Gammaproteobacteria bacterium]|nr:hypothetical protein [Gammaproteobacteria bacterium]